ncbi:MAG TPA: hypothetical protein VHW69_01315 [Rhizomicrobium sp.]|jgi:hypothetical protein|nr:hypothetical protein [Rhizomicrobium sp.]
MHFHLPKPLHGWREFLGEVGVIVIGVLIALGFEQIVQSVHDRNVAAEARDNVRDEAALNLSAIRERLDLQPCIERRLGEISRILSKAGDGILQTQPSWIGLPPTWPFFHARWEAATASGRNSLFPFDEQQRFSQIYEVFSRYDEYQAREQELWAQLRVLETWQGPLGAEARWSFASALQQAKYFAWDLNYAGTYAIRNGAAMGLSPPRPESHVHSICLPITTSRADALRQLKSPFGAP